jgi:hypothetical protein
MTKQKPTQFPAYNPKKTYEKLPHKYNVGQEVTLPGTRIRGPQYKNQFMYNKSGTIEKLGWSKKPVAVNDQKIHNEDTGGYWWSRKLVHVPMYLVKGRWYAEGKKNYGVTI